MSPPTGSRDWGARRIVAPPEPTRGFWWHRDSTRCWSHGWTSPRCSAGGSRAAHPDRAPVEWRTRGPAPPTGLSWPCRAGRLRVYVTWTGEGRLPVPLAAVHWTRGGPPLLLVQARDPGAAVPSRWTPRPGATGTVQTKKIEFGLIFSPAYRSDPSGALCPNHGRRGRTRPQGGREDAHGQRVCTYGGCWTQRVAAARSAWGARGARKSRRSRRAKKSRSAAEIDVLVSASAASGPPTGDRRGALSTGPRRRYG